MTFAEKLQKLRKQNGLSQERLAEKLNVSRQAVSKWEMGTIPDMENMVKLGRYFDCSLDYLMKDEVDTDNDQDTNNHNMDRKNSNGSIIERCISITCIMIGGIFAFLMPLFAKWYQAFEFRNYNECFTNSSDYTVPFGLHFNNSCFIIGCWNGVSLSFYSETLKFSYWTNSYTKNEKRITSVVLFFISKTRSGG